MTNRKILYGYIVQGGQYILHSEESLVVRRVFSDYTLGLSYQKISDSLNHDQIPYSPEDTLWNKHKVKRLLENERYIGDEHYPPIVEKETFAEVRTLIHEKSNPRTSKTPAAITDLFPLLRCSDCHERIETIWEDSDSLRLRCEHCDTAILLSANQLLRVTARQTAIHKEQGEIAYEPSGELIKFSNEINRKLEQDTDPTEVIELILKGVAIRYDCCTIHAPALETGQNNDIERITIYPDGQITVAFKDQ